MATYDCLGVGEGHLGQDKGRVDKKQCHFRIGTCARESLNRLSVAVFLNSVFAFSDVYCY